MFWSLQHLAEEPFGGSCVPFGAEYEIDRLAGGIDRAIDSVAINSVNCGGEVTGPDL